MGEGTLAQVLAGEATWTVCEGDCLEVLPTIPDRAVAHVITDSPYSEHTHAKVRRGGSTHAPDDTTPGKPKRAVISSATVLGFAALMERERTGAAQNFARISRRWVLEFSDQEGAMRWADANVAAGLQHVRIGQWVKVGATPQFTGDRPGTGAEAIAIAHPPGRKRWNGGGRHGLWVFPIAQGDRVHTTQKPLDLMLALVADFTDPGELVLDAFAGSGTTGVACLRLGRRFIGIEKDAKYAAIARERLRAEANGLSLRDARSGQVPMFPETP